MKVIESFQKIKPHLNNCVIALGTFDGIHLGHRAVIDAAIRYGQEKKHPIIVFSFSNHPRAFINPEQAPAMLLDNQEKTLLLDELGVDVLVNIKFDEHIINIEPTDFLELLCKYLKPQAIFVGDNFTYGKLGKGNTNTLKTECLQRKIFLNVLPMLTINGITVSSSTIRALLAKGNIELANKLLGRKYSFRGKVVHGAKIGRTIGFPTANIELPTLVPPNGGYIAEVKYNNKLYPAIANIGINPTVGTALKKRLEVHIFDFNEDIYGKEIVVYLHKYLVGEIKFNSIEDLKKHIKDISKMARDYFLY